MIWPKPQIYYGTHCILEPLSLEHHDDLIEAVQEVLSQS